VWQREEAEALLTAPIRRAKRAYPPIIARLEDFLDGDDLSDRVPVPARRIGLYLGRIAAVVSTLPEPGLFEIDLPCRRRPALVMKTEERTPGSGPQYARNSAPGIGFFSASTTSTTR
jgi:hypothetical protein